MNRCHIVTWIASPAGVVITLVMLLFALLFVQNMVTIYTSSYTDKDIVSSMRIPDDPNERITRSAKNFLPDGTVHLVSQEYKYRSFERDYSNEQIYDVNGTLLWKGLHRDCPYEYLSWAEEPMNSSYEGFIQYLVTFGVELSQTLEVPVSSSERTEEVWRYDPSADLFVGYRFKGGKIGYIGSTGFTEKRTEAGTFGKLPSFASWTNEAPASVIMLWQTDKCIYQIDFAKHQVEKVFESPQDNIESVKLHHWRVIPEVSKTPAIRYRPLMHCATKDGKHHLIMREPNEILTVDVPREWDSRSVKFAATDSDVFVRCTKSDFRPPVQREQSPKAWEQYLYLREYNSKPQKRSEQLYKVDDKGGLELIARFDWVRPPHEVRIRDDWVKAQICTVSPPAYDLAWYLFEGELLRIKDVRTGVMPGYAGIVVDWRPRYNPTNWVFSITMMIVSFLHGWSRRNSLARLIFWLVLVGLFNLAGLLTYLAMNHTPVIKCPVCGKKRGLERVDCVRCGSVLPQPERKKTDLILAG